MANEHLETYLNDHLAGSVGALDLLEHLAEEHAGTDMKRFLAELRADIAADQQELEALMDRLGVAKSRPRKAAGWIAEKVTQLKLRLDDPTGGTLRRFESLEALGLGIQGKLGLWRALAAAAEDAPELQGVEYARLAQRAEDQHSRVEVKRLEAAKVAFRAAP